MSTAVTAEMEATHRDRPTPKTQPAIRRIPWVIGGRAGHAIEYDTPVPSGGKTVDVLNTIPIEKPLPGLYSEPLQVFAYHVSCLMDDYYRVQAEKDGLLATIDSLTTEREVLKGDVAKLQNQLAEARRSANRGKKGDEHEGR